ncbi:MAG: hypothetical protein VKQ33_16185 [Candidatus Sericytochromatia bacterium]|nr:hypothetical protein [Candidatus Sericytochromatia bacterium]
MRPLLAAGALLVFGVLPACGGRPALVATPVRAVSLDEVALEQEQGDRTLVVDLVLEPQRMLLATSAGQDAAYVEVSLLREQQGVNTPALATLRVDIPRDVSRPLRFRNLRSNTTYVVQGTAYAADGMALSDAKRSQARILTGRSLTEDSVRLSVALLDSVFAASGGVTLGIASSLERAGLRGVVSWFTGDPGAFREPASVVEGPDGSFYVADVEANCIFRYTEGGEPTLLAGSGSPGWRDGSGDQAMFKAPQGLTIEPGGDLLVADTGNHCLRRVSPDGRVITLAGGRAPGFEDGVGTRARFNSPRSVTLAPDGGVYLADTKNHRIRHVTPAGRVTTLAGGNRGNRDGVGVRARFDQPSGLAFDSSNNTLVVADAGNNRVRRVTLEGRVTTVADSFLGRFSSSLRGPLGLAVFADGGVVVADSGNNRLRLLSPSGRVTTLAGTTPGHRDGAGADARLNRPTSVALTRGGEVIVVDSGNRSLRRVTREGLVATIGQQAGAPAAGAGLAARFLRPGGLSVSSDGRVAVVDEQHHAIRLVDPEGRVTLLAGNGNAGLRDGGPAEAAFSSPGDVAADLRGGWIVADTGNRALRRISPDGMVSTLQAGRGGPLGWLGGFLASTVATLSAPAAVAVAPNGDVIVADRGNHGIYRLPRGGVLTRVAGTGWQSHLDGPGGQARFSAPGGLAIDTQGRIYVADTGNHCIRQIDPSGVVRTVAGSRQAGLVDGAARDARFTAPLGLVLEGEDTILVADSGNHAIRRVKPDGQVSTVAGGTKGFLDAQGANARFHAPAGLAWLRTGEVLVAESGNRCLRLIR